MRIDILTLFPEIALAPLSENILQRARAAGLVDIHAHNIRDWSIAPPDRILRLLAEGLLTRLTVSTRCYLSGFPSIYN